ncbi:hypothetical protein SAMD00019534_030770 [Acytostelium subglobosum LB1]|uniref:hypothetical protein n=1 Tax=Acytostelium subglobosum LB1 TaxID=1410327 RepID=UPI00064522C0|nr:hypothetical protein SAMD00019534_030770 [Acytostelium subglobosum LB1]GAM19902.1 hypothetical protein SAMD00019534_030770 [Acytostelium subglobosum LB1]|eukprot:XP_012756664.1 hypothetical protein SAMD00019534_030770 [Acytostelium subglobosum LB1]
MIVGSECIVLGTQQDTQLSVSHIYRMLPIYRKSSEGNSYIFFESKDDDDYYYTRVNEAGPSTKTRKVNIPFFGYPMMDRAWLENKLYKTAAPHKAISQVMMRDSKIDVKAVYVSLQDPITSCPAVTEQCSDGKVITYKRDDNRCLHFDSCVTPERCSYYTPKCFSGYKLISVPSPRRGCPRFICDAEFLSETGPSV